MSWYGRRRGGIWCSKDRANRFYCKFPTRRGSQGPGVIIGDETASERPGRKRPTPVVRGVQSNDSAQCNVAIQAPLDSHNGVYNHCSSLGDVTIQAASLHFVRLGPFHSEKFSCIQRIRCSWATVTDLLTHFIGQPYFQLGRINIFLILLKW
jgi:hypothetical protein